MPRKPLTDAQLLDVIAERADNKDFFPELLRRFPRQFQEARVRAVRQRPAMDAAPPMERQVLDQRRFVQCPTCGTFQEENATLRSHIQELERNSVLMLEMALDLMEKQLRRRDRRKQHERDTKIARRKNQDGLSWQALELEFKMKEWAVRQAFNAHMKDLNQIRETYEKYRTSIPVPRRATLDRLYADLLGRSGVSWQPEAH